MKSIPELLLGLLVNHWVNIAVWLVLLALAAYGFFNQVTWLKSYLVYLKIYFYIQAPWIIPFWEPMQNRAKTIGKNLAGHTPWARVGLGSRSPSTARTVYRVQRLQQFWQHFHVFT